MQRGSEINRDLVTEWVTTVTALAKMVQAQSNAARDAFRGHTEAITTWITGEANSVQKAARAQAEAIHSAKRDHARARYAGMSNDELADLLAQRDLPRNGTKEELIARLVEADIQ